MASVACTCVTWGAFTVHSVPPLNSMPRFNPPRRMMEMIPGHDDDGGDGEPDPPAADEVETGLAAVEALHGPGPWALGARSLRSLPPEERTGGVVHRRLASSSSSSSSSSSVVIVEQVVVEIVVGYFVVGLDVVELVPVHRVQRSTPMRSHRSHRARRARRRTRPPGRRCRRAFPAPAVVPHDAGTPPGRIRPPGLGCRAGADPSRWSSPLPPAPNRRTRTPCPGRPNPGRGRC